LSTNFVLSFVKGGANKRDVASIYHFSPDGWWCKSKFHKETCKQKSELAVSWTHHVSNQHFRQTWPKWDSPTWTLIDRGQKTRALENNICELWNGT
jgi:hypothetical protein